MYKFNMDNTWEDYYKLLQVHYQAEPDTIKNAYKFLSKKYHPDINKNLQSNDIMKKINIAYSILNDVYKRKIYDVEWLQKTQNNHKYLSFHTYNAQLILENYYNNIITNNLKAAYNYISKKDKLNISKFNFIKWQSSVAKIFKLENYKINFNVEIVNTNNKNYENIFNFTILLYEHDILNNKSSRYTVSKTVIYEKGFYGVFLGYTNIKSFIILHKQYKKIALKNNSWP